MREVVISGAVRTAIGKLGGSLSAVSAPELGAIVLNEAIRRSGLGPDDIQEVVLGHVIQAGVGPNPARMALLTAGLPESVPGYTVNKVCASGMKAVALGALSIASGEQDIVAVGGMENMTRAPFLLERAREGYRLGDGELLDTIWRDALRDPLISCHMGDTAEVLADDFDITREEQDAFAAGSQVKTAAAVSDGRFEAEIVPVPVPQRKGDPLMFEADEFPRPDTTAEDLGTLRPAFKPDGTVTAGNASGINDGHGPALGRRGEETGDSSDGQDRLVGIGGAGPEADGPRAGWRYEGRAGPRRSCARGHRDRGAQRGLRRAVAGRDP
jgi:acetyl-CoA C-acetyltransferase